MKKLVFAAVVLLGLVAQATEYHVPEVPKGRYTIKASAAKKGHVLFVNVGQAISAKDWTLATSYVGGLFQVNLWTNQIDKIDVGELLKGKCPFGGKSKVCVFLVNDPNALTYLASPGKWSVINVAPFLKGVADKQTYRDRTAKLLLKGLAYAAGCGASMEGRCALSVGGFDAEGIDKTNITITPMTYFPMLEMLRKVGGDELLDVCEPEEE